jgi:hypothetical protein
MMKLACSRSHVILHCTSANSARRLYTLAWYMPYVWAAHLDRQEVWAGPS